MSEGNRATGDANEQIERALSFGRKATYHWRWVAGAVLLGAVACAVFFAVRTPPYRSETVILYTDGIRASADAPAASTPHEAAVRIREMLLSRQRLEALIARFDLYRKTRDRYGIVDAVEEFREHIAFRAPGSDTYTIGFEGTSAEQARDVTTALARSLIDEDAAMRKKKAEVTRDFLQEERKSTESDLRAAEQLLAQFLAEHPTFALDSMLLMPGASPTGAAIRAAEAEQTARPSAGPRRAVARATAPGAARRPSQLAAEKVRAETDLHAAQTALSAALSRYTQQHPDVRSAEAAVQRAEARLGALNVAIASELGHAQQAARSPRRSSPQARGGAKSKELKTSDELVLLETEWTRLTRLVNEARTRHEQIEASFFKADIAASSASESRGARMTVLDPAYLPTRPAPPGRLTLAAVFLALSLMLGVAGACLKAAVDDRAYRARDLRDAGFTVLSVIPRDEQPSHAR